MVLALVSRFPESRPMAVAPILPDLPRRAFSLLYMLNCRVIVLSLSWSFKESLSFLYSSCLLLASLGPRVVTVSMFLSLFLSVVCSFLFLFAAFVACLTLVIELCRGFVCSYSLSRYVTGRKLDPVF
jgi:hypothetical protein